MYHNTSKRYVGEIIIAEARRVVNEALLHEMESSFKQKHPIDFERLWPRLKSIIENQDDEDAEDAEDDETRPLAVDLVVSADMGWQKRSSGHRYDSPSGHMFFIGAQTNKIIDYEVMCVSCAKCQSAKKRNKVAKQHHCSHNFNGHAKAMEASVAQNLIVKRFEESRGKCRISTVVADDDSSMRKKCSHQGGLPLNVHEPLFLADPSHRCKLISRPVFKLATAAKSVSKITKTDALRIKVYVCCFFNVNRKKNKSLEWMVEHVWCVLYHLFDDHHLCTPDFCWKKRLEVEEETDADENQQSAQTSEATSSESGTSSGRDNNSQQRLTLSKMHALRKKRGYYRCMKEESEVFCQLRKALSSHFSTESIKEMMHGSNTQTNEGLNNAIAYVAPKNRNYSKSRELMIRVSLVAGCHNLGKFGFIKRVIDRMHFQNEPSAFLNLLRDEDKAKVKKQKNQSMIGHKRRRAHTRVVKALESRKKDIQAVANGTTYGDQKVRARLPSKCPYSRFGCDTPGHKHTTLRSMECKYHYLWEDRDLDTRVSPGEWMERVEEIWREDNHGELLRNQLSARDTLNIEFNGNIDLVSNIEIRQNPSDSIGDEDSEILCQQITQDSLQGTSQLSAIELFDQESVGSRSGSSHTSERYHDNGLEDSDDDDSDDNDSDHHDSDIEMEGETYNNVSFSGNYWSR